MALSQNDVEALINAEIETVFNDIAEVEGILRHIVTQQNSIPTPQQLIHFEGLGSQSACSICSEGQKASTAATRTLICLSQRDGVRNCGAQTAALEAAKRVQAQLLKDRSLRLGRIASGTAKRT